MTSRHIRKAPTLVRTMMPGSANRASPAIALLSPTGKGEGTLPRMESRTFGKTGLPYLEELKAQGKIRAIGITHWSSSHFARMATIVETGRIEAIQIPYNPREREVEAELLPLAGGRGLGVVLMRPLEKGALARTAPPARELGFLADYGIRTWAQALLNWGVSDPRVSVTIPATRDVKHAIDNCEVGDARRFDAAARDRVAALAARWP